MDDIEKQAAHLIEPIPASLEAMPMPQDEPPSDLIAGIFRRWYIVLIVCIFLLGAGLPAIWLLIKPHYIVVGAIEIAPISSNILTGVADEGEIFNYESYKNTMAKKFIGNNVVQRVADSLRNNNLLFFETDPNSIVEKLKYKVTGIKPDSEPASILKRALSDGVITVLPERGTFLLQITMDSVYPNEARQIVNTFINRYMEVEVVETNRGYADTLAQLEIEQKDTYERLRIQQQEISQLADESGNADLTGQQDMSWGYINNLMSDLIGVEASRIELESLLKYLQDSEEQVLTPEEVVRRRSDYITQDPTIQQLAQEIVLLQKELIEIKQLYQPEDHRYKRKQQSLEMFQELMEQEREKVAKNFDEIIAEEIKIANKEKLNNVQAQLNRTRVHEERLREELDKELAERKQTGQAQRKIAELKFNQTIDQELYDKYRLRIREVELERKRPAKISVSNFADVWTIRDKRAKYSAALVFLAAASGCGLAFLRDKADKKVRTPEDLAKRIGIRIIGTTTSSRKVEPSLFATQIAGDYQTIRTNLTFLNTEGMPKKLVVTSPGIQEGKTTFAINLATSISKSGKKVLLVDGDLRKPDIGYSLNIPGNRMKLYDLLTGASPDQTICSIASSGLDVLASHSPNSIDVYELIASPYAAEQLDKLFERYDHVIIDTPPVLAFPDAMVWAKIAGTAILTSFAGQTNSPDLKQTKERLEQANIKVLGTVLGNVPIRYSYYRYGYDYYTQNDRSRRKTKMKRKKLLLPVHSEKDKVNTH